MQVKANIFVFTFSDFTSRKTGEIYHTMNAVVDGNPVRFFLNNETHAKFIALPQIKEFNEKGTCFSLDVVLDFYLNKQGFWSCNIKEICKK